MLLIAAARCVLLQVDVQRLPHAINRLDVVLAEGLRAVLEFEFAPLDDPWNRPEPSQLVL